MNVSIVNFIQVFEIKSIMQTSLINYLVHFKIYLCAVNKKQKTISFVEIKSEIFH